MKSKNAFIEFTTPTCTHQNEISKFQKFDKKINIAQWLIHVIRLKITSVYTDYPRSLLHLCELKICKYTD